MIKFLILIGTIVAASLTTAAGQKPKKFAHIDKSIPTHISVKGIKADEDDSLSLFLKDTLRITGFKIIGNQENIARIKQYSLDGQNKAKSFATNPPKNKDEIYRRMFSGATPVQSFEISYVSDDNKPVKDNATATMVVISLMQLPFENFPELPKPVVVRFDEIGSHDSRVVGRYLFMRL